LAAPWRLPALLLGGLEQSQATTDRILRLDLARGTATPAGRLAAPVHDAAGRCLTGHRVPVGPPSRVTPLG
jgi:hypothetical protein